MAAQNRGEVTLDRLVGLGAVVAESEPGADQQGRDGPLETVVEFGEGLLPGGETAGKLLCWRGMHESVIGPEAAEQHCRLDVVESGGEFLDGLGAYNFVRCWILLRVWWHPLRSCVDVAVRTNVAFDEHQTMWSRDRSRCNLDSDVGAPRVADQHKVAQSRPGDHLFDVHCKAGGIEVGRRRRLAVASEVQRQYPPRRQSGRDRSPNLGVVARAVEENHHAGAVVPLQASELPALDRNPQLASGTHHPVEHIVGLPDPRDG
jgi:hypothetical protein